VKEYLEAPPSVFRTVVSFIVILSMIAALSLTMNKCSKKEEKKEAAPSYRIEKGRLIREVKINVGKHNEAWVLVLEK